MTVFMNLGTVNVDKVIINSCSFGKLSALLMRTELNNFFRLFTPVINGDLQNHPFQVPSNVFGVFVLSELTIGYFNDYLYIGMTPTFVAPGPAEPIMEQLLMVQ